MTDDAANDPLSEAEFNLCLATCGSFEPKPLLAVAVSGGADSMALCLLADRWARGRGGKVIALTVDHGLRPESAGEAAQVGIWLQQYGIEHHILPWNGEKPATGVQQAARLARYRLLGRWCAARGILHLLVAHHREDQAETYALRLARGSGIEGLAAMPAKARLPVQLVDAPLLLRPLLVMPKARLLATLRSMKQDWIEDPSNSQDKYQRVRLRRLFASAAPGMPTIDEALAAVAESQRQNALLEAASMRFFAAHTRVDPVGFASVDRSAFCDLEPDLARRILTRLTVVIGGRVYPPRFKRLATLDAAVRTTPVGGWTMGGCLFEVTNKTILVFREAANCREELTFDPGQGDVFWDRRFRIGVRRAKSRNFGSHGAVVIRKLGAAGWRQVVADDPSRRDISMPLRAKVTLPAIYLGDRLLAVPILGYGAKDFYSEFDPARPLSG